MIQILLMSLLLTVAQTSPTPIADDAGPSASTSATAPAGTDSPESASPDGGGADPAGKSASPDGEANEGSDSNEPKATAVSKMIGTLDEITQSGAMGLLRDGGFFMWPILLMGVIAAGVIIERYRSLKMLSTDSARSIAVLLRYH